ncbi:MAG TPA: PQQ-binding-like beta-propeller repeat protein [Gaiellaceae bacterium]|nr:PQQ-binding-like beta-propeller repeat protein [Gaiellaceae bacterium]
MPTRRRLLVLAALAAPLPLAAGLGWLVFGFVPLRAAVVGPFAASAQTPAQAHRAAAPAPAWPMFGASPARTRFVPSDLRPPFRLVYTIPGGGLIEMPPAVAEGRLVFGTHEGDVVAARASDGALAWVRRLGRCIASSPAVHAGVVYIGWSGAASCVRGKDERGGLVALSLATGEVLWRFNPGNVESSPAVAGGVLYFAAFRSRSESRVFALRLRPPRRVLWSYPIASKVASSPSLAGRTLVVSAYDRYLYGLDARSGALRWRTTAFSSDDEAQLLLGVRSLVTRRSWREGGFYATPTVGYRRVYAGVIDGVFSAFDVRTGAHRWSRKLEGSIYGSAALWKEKVYVGTTEGVFYALSARDGSVVWRRDLGGAVLGSPTVTNGRVWIATTARRTYVLDARTGEVEWVFGDGRYSPLVVVGDRAYVVGKGRVYALENARRGPAFSRSSRPASDRDDRRALGWRPERLTG